MTTATKKLTIATVKAFIRKNLSKLLIEVRYDFDGMSDCVHSTGSKGFVPASASSNPHEKYNMGINGVWFTSGRNGVNRVETATHIGYEVGNSCGLWTVAVAK